MQIIASSNLDIVVVAKKVVIENLIFLANNYPSYRILVVTNDSSDVIYSLPSNVEFNKDNSFLIREEFIQLFADMKRSGGRNLHQIAGWYYQQCLKYSIVLKSVKRFVLIVDGDSMLSGNKFLTEHISVLNKKTQKEYKKFNELVLPKQLQTNFLSAITNQMLFDQQKLMQLLQLIENKYSKNWINSIIELIRSNEDLMFSEYQLYADYVVSFYQIPTIKSTIFRRADAVCFDNEKILNKYDIISFESHHKTTFLRKVKYYVYYLLGLNLG